MPNNKDKKKKRPDTPLAETPTPTSLVVNKYGDLEISRKPPKRMPWDPKPLPHYPPIPGGGRGLVN